MNKQDAVGIATRFIADQIGPDLMHPALGKIVIEEEFVREHELAWIVPFNSVAFLETRDFDKACIPSIIAVPKSDLPAFLPPTSLPAMEFLDEVRDSGQGLQEWVDLDRGPGNEDPSADGTSTADDPAAAEGAAGNFPPESVPRPNPVPRVVRNISHGTHYRALHGYLDGNTGKVSGGHANAAGPDRHPPQFPPFDQRRR